MPVAGAFSCPARYHAPKAPADRASDHAKGGAGHCALRPHFLGLCRNDFCRPELAMCAGITPAARASFAPLRRGFSFWNDSPRRQRGAIPFRQLLANAAIADSRVAAYPCVGMLCLLDSVGQVFRPRPWRGQRDSSVKEGGSKYESNIVPDPAIREAIDSDVQKEASKQGKQ